VTTEGRAPLPSTSTFMGTPLLDSASARQPLAAILGIPFDCGTHPYRIGSRHGPEAIRQQSQLVRPYRAAYETDSPTESVALVDAGDVRCRPGDVDATYPRIQESVQGLLERSIIPITMGGDGAVTLPQLRALSQVYPDLVVLHIDSHTDAFPVPGYNTATTFTRAAEEGVIDVGASFHIGARGSTFVPEVLSHTESLGYKVIPFSAMREEGLMPLFRRVAAELEGRKVYLCFDMDIFDPSCAPGVCTPECGGLSAEEGLNAIRALSGVDFVAFDINTMSPPQDVGGITALLAATVMYECCALALASPRHATPRHAARGLK